MDENVSGRHRVILDVDTGTDDAGALWCAATHRSFDLVAALSGWGNTTRAHTVRNTLAVLRAAGSDAPVHEGLDAPSGPAPTTHGAELVMAGDGLGGVGVEPPAGATASTEPAPEALVRMASEHPGDLTLVALAPLTTVDAALTLEPRLPSLLRSTVVMGGAIAVSGNVTAVAEANIGHDPGAAARVIEAFGAPGALAGGEPPMLVPLDATLRSPLTEPILEEVERSPLPGAALIHRVWSAIWETGLIELGEDGEGCWPCHDLTALWALVDHGALRWFTGPLAVDTGRSAAWGATVLDRRGRFATDGAGTWSVAFGVDHQRYLAGVRAWLQGGSAWRGSS